MARIHGTDTRIYVEEYNLSGRSNVLDLEAGADVEEITAFEETGDAQVFIDSKSSRNWNAKIGAFADYTSTEIDAILNALINTGGADKRIGLYITGAAAGSFGYEGIGLMRLMRNVAPRGPQRIDAEFIGRDATFLSQAMKLNEATAITGTGASTAQQHRLAAASGDQIIFVARVTAVDGAGSATFRLEAAPDGSTWATVGTLSAMTAVGAQHAVYTAGGAVGPHFRLNTTAFSGFTSVTVRVAVGIIKNS